MLLMVALYRSVNRFVRGRPVGDWVERRRLARTSAAAPMNHVSVESAVSVQCQTMIREEAPAFSIGGHWTKIKHPLRITRIAVNVTV